MTGLIVLLAYLFGGYVCAQVVLHDKSPLLRIWLGVSFGMLLFMWLPALFAFVVGFTVLGQILSGAVLLLIVGTAVLYRVRHPKTVCTMDDADRRMLLPLCCFVIPLTVLTAYLQHTHTLRDVDGALHVGQSTFGDLPMHLSIVKGLVGEKLPTEYLFLPGAPLGYPMLTDATGTSLLILGLPLRYTLIVPGVIMSALVYGGYLLLAREMTGKTSAAVIAGVLLFFNGGLGFLYDFDLSGHDLSKIQEIFTGYYATPANQPEFNLRWSNLVVDLLLPQRTFLGGWTLLLPALYFAREAFKTTERRMFLLVALFGAALPLVHTHSFLALALYSAAALVYRLITDKEKRRALLTGSAIYLGIVLVCAIPQIFGFTMRQVTNEGFIKFHFNWVNNTRDGFVDFYPWFWLKNIGLPLIFMICALIDFKRKHRMDMLGATLIFIVAETILFQPLDYDNNKLFYIWYLLMLPAAADWCVNIWHKIADPERKTHFPRTILRSHAPSHLLLAVLFFVTCTLSGGLSMAREVISDYELFSKSDAEASSYIEETTEKDAIFMTALQHNNPVFALAGRRVVCGPSNFLYTHGLDYYERENDVRMFYSDPEYSLYLLEKYDVSYIALGPYELSLSGGNIAAFDSLFDKVYDGGAYAIYAVPDTIANP